MKFEDGVTGPAVVVSVQGRVDATTAELFEAHCRRQMTERNRQSLVLDLATVEYLSSAGLRSILSLGKQTRAAGGRLVLCGLQGNVLEIFQIAGFLELFPVAANLEQAVGLAMGPNPR
ncbi:MAG: STAS domain-containing protein [Candidatus Marinimicrobia bacterium]|nr:STAS domain-containing protein [Candidatus Neomarinimicrobiota bacterium]